MYGIDMNDISFNPVVDGTDATKPRMKRTRKRVGGPDDDDQSSEGE